MNFSDQLRLIQRLHNLIARKSTGPPEKLAIRLQISRASLFRYLNALRDLGAVIDYCKYHQSYIYREPFIFAF